MRRARDERAVLISEPLARRSGRGVGDALILDGPAGRLELPIAGVFHDYGNESGSIFMDLAALRERFGPGPIHSVGVYLEPGRDPEAMVDALKIAFADAPLRIRGNRRLREDVLAVFDQTFAVTRILQAMALLIAVCGITLTLLVLARERVSELALYRALGARRRQIFGVFLGKGLSIALLGLALGIAGGIVLALILVFLINREYFGWTIRMAWPWSSILGQAGTILAAATVAALYPALRASRIPATELSREEVA
jgi:putative ABC transport system permease protein